MSALPLVDPLVVLEACTAAAQDATDRWSSETAAEWWEAAVRAFDSLPVSQQSADDRDDLLVARVEALARAGRGQTVLDVVNAGLLEAVREGRTSAVGRLAGALLRAAGAWPWVSYGTDPGPLLERARGGRALGRERQGSSRTGSCCAGGGKLLPPRTRDPESMERPRSRHRPRTRRSGCDRGRAARTDSAFLRSRAAQRGVHAPYCASFSNCRTNNRVSTASSHTPSRA